MGVKDITYEQFWKAYNNHLPSGWIKFAYRYFSRQTVAKDMVLNNVVIYTLIGLFVIGFLGTAFSAPRAIIGTATIAYSIILGILVLYLFSAVKLNNLRIKRIAKELGVTLEQYNQLAEKYYHE
ncbi:MAG: hypothetical protein WC333_00520 [Dehalococcoidia bacterium]|jgi:ABC-type multidrug transport system fused ATPase/permease subunit